VFLVNKKYKTVLLYEKRDIEDDIPPTEEDILYYSSGDLWDEKIDLIPYYLYIHGVPFNVATAFKRNKTFYYSNVDANFHLCKTIFYLSKKKNGLLPLRDFFKRMVSYAEKDGLDTHEPVIHGFLDLHGFLNFLTRNIYELPPKENTEEDELLKGKVVLQLEPKVARLVKEVFPKIADSSFTEVLYRKYSGKFFAEKFETLKLIAAYSILNSTSPSVKLKDKISAVGYLFDFLNKQDDYRRECYIALLDYLLTPNAKLFLKKDSYFKEFPTPKVTIELKRTHKTPVRQQTGRKNVIV